MKVAIVDKNAKTRLRTKLILERTNPEHIYETYVGICPWPELTDPSIEMMVIGSPEQTSDRHMMVIGTLIYLRGP